MKEILNIRQLVELVAKNEELSVSGRFFQTAVLGELAADIFGTPCYYAPENEPIFGLYYLLEKPKKSINENKQVLLACIQSIGTFIKKSHTIILIDFFE